MHLRLLVLACAVAVCYGQWWGFDDDRFENRFGWRDDMFDDRPFGFVSRRFQQPTWRTRQRQTGFVRRQSFLPQQSFYQPRFGNRFFYSDDGFDW
uniref:Uncharacterized protein n=1 Tax=Magallana gigas TaxID=29159 RepID=K1RUC9_MAGGI